MTIAGKRRLLALCCVAVISVALVLGVKGASNNKSDVKDSSYEQLRGMYVALLNDNIELSANLTTLDMKYKALKIDSDNAYRTIESLNKLVARSASAPTVTITADVSSYIRALQDANERYISLERRYIACRASEQDLKGKWEREVAAYNALTAALSRVSSRTDSTVTTNLTAAERAGFFKMWDLWYDTLPDR